MPPDFGLRIADCGFVERLTSGDYRPIANRKSKIENGMASSSSVLDSAAARDAYAFGIADFGFRIARLTNAPRHWINRKSQIQNRKWTRFRP